MMLFPISLSAIPNFTKGSKGPIAVVDDDVEQLEIIKRYYKKTSRDNELLLFSDAETVKDYIFRVQEQSAVMPALILVDINMPIKNGFETVASLREMPIVDEVPIIMFSVSEYEKDIQRAKKEGASAYMTKPSKGSDYVRLLESL